MEKFIIFLVTFSIYYHVHHVFKLEERERKRNSRTRDLDKNSRCPEEKNIEYELLSNFVDNNITITWIINQKNILFKDKFGQEILVYGEKEIRENQ